MKQRPHLKSSTPRNILLGAEVQLDIQTWFSRGNTKSKAYTGAKHALTIVDLCSDFTWTFGLTDLKRIVRFLEILRRITVRNKCTLRVIRCDNAFFSREVRDWALDPAVDIQLLPCAPHEHYQIGRVERKHQTLHHIVTNVLQ